MITLFMLFTRFTLYYNSFAHKKCKYTIFLLIKILLKAKISCFFFLSLAKINNKSPDDAKRASTFC